MENIKDFCGFLLGLAFCAAALILSAIAWVGLENALGWRWALGCVVASLLMRINFAVVAGLYSYASYVLGWPMAESIAFALPGMLIIMPVVATSVFGALVGTAARR
jgi:hypothetical protein